MKKIIFIFTVFCIVILGISKAQANLSFVKPVLTEAQKSMDIIEKTEISKDLPKTAKARAPEPSTLVLFGSGIFGIIVSAIRRTYHIIKRLFDIIAASLGFIILSPLLILAALLIKLTSNGPLIYKQTRVGKDGELFDMYKFRTMTVDAEKGTGPVWASKNDTRLIPCGKFLRLAHIDELPQLANILRGEMSLIGPRPERPVFVEQFKQQIFHYEQRLTVKPGLTGLAQVWHKYDETVEDVKNKLRYDLLYIKNLCLWTDVKILFRTVRVVFTGEGAH